MNGSKRAEIGVNGAHIVARHLGVGRVRHRRIKARTVVSYALAQGIVEVFVGPPADPGLLVGRDVGRNDIAEWRLDRTSAGKRRSSVGSRMTGGAVRRGDQIA